MSRSRATPAATMRVLQSLSAIQLDPLDPFLTNAELAVAARLFGYKKGMLFDPVNNGHYFEQWFKERCLLPAESFSHYTKLEFKPGWWKSVSYLQSVSEETVDRVLQTIIDAGPLTRKELDIFGNVVPHDWSGWTGTSKAIGVALEVLWTDCRITVVGRNEKGKRLYDIPERHFDVQADDSPYAHWAIEQRIQACGLISTNAGPIWRTLRKERTSGVVDELVAQKRILKVQIEDTPGTFLTTQEILDAEPQKPDSHMRVLGPLDNALWDRKLLARVFDFDYVWEVYKPASKRLWGWYVVPLLYKGAFVGRVEMQKTKQGLTVKNLWREKKPFPEKAWERCFQRIEKSIL